MFSCAEGVWQWAMCCHMLSLTTLVDADCSGLCRFALPLCSCNVPMHSELFHVETDTVKPCPDGILIIIIVIIIIIIIIIIIECLPDGV